MIRNLRTLLNGLRNVRSRVFRLAVECLRLAQRLDWPSPGVQAPPITVDRPLRRYFPPSRVSANWRNSEIRGEPRTNHQSVMECGRFRPTHPVEHHALELEQFRFLGISTKGESPVAPECVVELVGLEPTTRALAGEGSSKRR